MKRIHMVLMLLLFLAAPVFAVNFQPTPMKFSAASNIKYDFDGNVLSIPVTVSGTPANSIFCVFTKDKGETIRNVKNGYLGWHQVNRIDTSVYIAQPVQLEIGSNIITWNGKDDDGGVVPAGEYTYYIFGYDNISPKKVVNQFIMNAGGAGGKIAHIQEVGLDGKPLANPVWYGLQGKTRWVIGNDPADSALIETTTYILGEGFSSPYTIALMPTDFSYYFIRVVNPTSRIHGVEKFKWVPNGTSEFDTSWGDNGMVSWSDDAIGVQQPGPEIIGDYLWTATNFFSDKLLTAANLVMIDWKGGTLDKKIDISDVWTNSQDGPLGGRPSSGPNGVIARNGMLFLNHHASCLKSMVDPAASDNMDDFFLWTNGNGDYILDHNFEETSQRKWVCNDSSVGPYMYHLSADANLFSNASCYDMGAVSFGLLAPDGDGIGYFAFGSDTAGWKWFNQFVQNGGAFDGIYCDDNERWAGELAAKVSGIYYIAHNSIKGVLSNQTGVKESAPSAFMVSQNTPNPFNPTTTISFTLTRAGKTSVEVFNVAGQKVDTILNANLSAGHHSITWNASRSSAGVYFYTVKSGDLSKTMKMTLLK